jgi:hypothetical protein
MRPICLAALVWLLCIGCSERSPQRGVSISFIDTNSFAVLESELTPGILIHSRSKYLGMFAEAEAPAHIAFSTRNGPRPFRRGEKLKADELEECWLLLWSSNMPPWLVYLQRKPLAITLDTNGLHCSFENGAGDVVLLPLHGSSEKVDTAKWSEFLPREPLMRIRYWAGVLREFPLECDTSVSPPIVHQRFRFHSIRDDWKTKPLNLAPVSPPLAAAADENLKRKLMDLKMPTPFGPYMGFDGAGEWKAEFVLSNGIDTNCAWVSIGDCKVPRPNTALIHAIQTNGWPRIAHIGAIKPSRDQPAPPPRQILLNPSTRLVVYD